MYDASQGHVPVCVVAEEIGVIGSPELSTAVLSSSHAFLVIATDGVWEFLNSQTVVELVRFHRI